MVRNAGSMCITKTFYSEQYSTLQYNPRMYVTVLWPLPPHTYGISFLEKGEGTQDKILSRKGGLVVIFFTRVGRFYYFCCLHLHGQKQKILKGFQCSFCRLLLLPHLPSSAPHKALLKLADKQYQQSKANKSIAWH